MTDHLRSLTRAELEERAELFDANVRMLVNDELRRRHMPLVGERH